LCPQGLAEAYFHWLTRALGHQVASRIEAYSPTADVSEIINLSSTLRSEARRKGSAFDEVWCVVEGLQIVEDDGLARAAADKKIQLARVSPSVEKWLLAHFGEQSKSLTTNEANAAAGLLLPRAQNALGIDTTFDAIMSHYSVAKGHALLDPSIAEMVPLVEALIRSWQRFSNVAIAPI
jgi:hypothetical protein